MPSLGLGLYLGASNLNTGVRPPAGFAFIRTVPGTVMVDQNNRRVIGVALAGQGVAA